MNKTVALLVAVPSVFLTACSSYSTKHAEAAFNHPEVGALYTMVPVGMKDFEIKGVVFAKSHVEIDINGDKNGSEITYEMLMREAVKLGADDVINVRIDRQDEKAGLDNFRTNQLTQEETFSHRSYTKKAYTYTATGLAIKYTNTVSCTDKGTSSASSAPLKMDKAPGKTETLVPVPAAAKLPAPKAPRKRSLFSKK